MSTSPALVLLPLVLVLALWGIGALAAWCAGARRAATLVAAGLPVTVGVMAVLGVAEIFVPFPFGWLSLAAGTLVLAVVGRVVSARRKRGQREAPAEHAESQWREAAAMAGSLVATVMVASAVVFIAAGGTWETVSQTWDAMFDANAIRQAYLSGSIDPRTLVDFAFPHPVGSFYPATFHAIGTLAMHVLGCDAVVASNLAAVVVAGGLWPSCLVLAVRFLRGPRLSYSVLAAILTLGFWGMPWSPLGWGVLWATATAVAFAPLPIVGFATLLGLGPIARSRPSSLAMLLGGEALVAFSHPRVAMIIAFLLTGLWSVVALQRAWALRVGGAPARARTWALGAAAPWPAVGLAVLKFGRTDRFTAVDWPVDRPAPLELLGYLVNAPDGSIPQVLTAALVLIGAAVAWRDRRWQWLVVLWLGSVALDVVTATVRWRPINGLLRFWYSDRHRTIGVVTIAAVLLSMLGAAWVWSWLRAHPSSRLRALRRRSVAAGAAVVMALWGGVSATTYLWQTYAGQSRDPVASLVSDREIEFFRAVAKVVPPEDRVLNNANDGSSLLFAYTGVKPTFVLGGLEPSTPNALALRNQFITMDRKQRCIRMVSDHIGWIINSGPPYSKGIIVPFEAPNLVIPPGFEDTQLVIDDGERKLFRYTGECP